MYKNEPKFCRFLGEIANSRRGDFDNNPQNLAFRKEFLENILTAERFEGYIAGIASPASFFRLILESVKKLEELFIAPTARQILHETAQRAFARCECA